MAVALENAVIEIELAGVGGGWTDLTDDVRLGSGVNWGYGIRGTGPTDRVASTGTLTFSLNNAATNSAGLVGYYSPGHTNARAGFDNGCRVRVRLTYASTTTTKFIGRVASIVVVPGSARERLTVVTAVDWMDEAARFKIAGIPTQVDQRSDQVISVLLAAMPIQPESTSIATGQDTYAYALDSARDENSYALSEFQKVCLSEAGYLFVTGAGQLVFQSRHTRATITTNDYDLDNDMIDLDIDRSRDSIVNRIQVVAHPRLVDDSVVTLYTLQSVVRVLAGESSVVFGGYVDPNQLAARVGGFDMVAPVATTDYLMNAAEDGSGTNLTASLTVSTSFGGNGHYTTFTNTSSDVGYITFFRVRGKGIYDYENAIAIAEDTASQTAYGENVLSVDMPYQNNLAVARGFARYALSLLSSPRTEVKSVRFLADESNAHMLAAIAADPGMRLGIGETVSGLETTDGFFVQSVDFELMGARRLMVTVTLSPASTQSVWVLATSALGVNTTLGYL